MKSYIFLYIILITQCVEPYNFDIPNVPIFSHQQAIQYTTLFSIGCITTYGSYSLYNYWLNKKQPTKKTKIKHIKITNQGIEDMQNANDAMRLIYQLYTDSSIQGVFIEMNAGGGPIGLCELLHREILLLKQHKPVIVLVKDSCTQSAYMLASAATEIIAPLSAIVGGIGTKLALTHEKPETFKHPSGLTGTVHKETVSAGSYKVFTPEADNADAFRENMQRLCDRLYVHICNIIANTRNLSVKDNQIWADGKNFNGNQALEFGLIDRIGSYTDAYKVLKQYITDQFGSCSEDIIYC